MKRNTVLSMLTLLVIGCVLSACTVTIPIPSTVDGSSAPQVVTLAPSSGVRIEQVDYQSLPAYQAWLSGFQAPVDRLPSIESRFNQISDRQTLADYQAYLAGFQTPPDLR